MNLFKTKLNLIMNLFKTKLNFNNNEYIIKNLIKYSNKFI